ncbi:MAG: hypothetical protein GWO16_06160, partial [Gammaproteobacteria bacterium]|nr:hypothetical protein [Gammaproteobacteria bacterium]NIR98247.1 hypothetical protein [Gammaproteobacteria bacterium]NIT63921.1 hypothetical protein [Gammaproteobacteria bacterium]NIV20925.1 hypothetical protein [Gammaproteobacteria bacterium]NIY32501.1 hypothetical protein [Gammaproteobacteria bacterium]
MGWIALAGAIALPLLLSPLLAVGLTLSGYSPLARWLRSRSCVCLTQPAPVLLGVGETAQAARGLLPSLRVAHRSDCRRGDEQVRWNTEEILHWG